MESHPQISAHVCLVFIWINDISLGSCKRLYQIDSLSERRVSKKTKSRHPKRMGNIDRYQINLYRIYFSSSYGHPSYNLVAMANRFCRDALRGRIYISNYLS